MTIAVELDPPSQNRDGDSLSFLLNGAALLKEAGADLLTMADNPCADSRADCAVLAPLVSRIANIPVMPHLACRDRGVRALRSALLALDSCGIHEFLAVTGDPAPRGFENTKSAAKSMFGDQTNYRNAPCINSTDLAALAFEWAEESFSKPFSVSAALNINAPNFEAELRKAERKISAGVTRFFTQPVLCDEALVNLGRAYSVLNAKILGGILPIVSAKNALFLEKHIPGIRVSKEIIAQYQNASKEEAQQLALSISVTFAREMTDFADGWYVITPFRRVSLAAQIVRELHSIRQNKVKPECQVDKSAILGCDLGLTPRGSACYKVS